MQGTWRDTFAERDLHSFFVSGGQEKHTGDLGWQIWQREAGRKPM